MYLGDDRPATLAVLQLIMQMLHIQANMTLFAKQIAEECKLEFAQFRINFPH